MFYDSAPKLVAVVLILGIPAIILFALRCHVRLNRTKWGSDDWLMAAAMPFFLLLSISALISAGNGVGVHYTRLSATETVTGLKWFYLAQVFFCISILFVKVSIAMQLVRIASQKRSYLVGLYVVIGVIVISLAFTTIYLLSQCTPIKANWNPATPGAKCLPSLGVTIVSFTQSGVNIVTDWICAILPVPLLWDVKMNTQSKLSVLLLLGLGVFASISAMIRLRYTVSYMNPTQDYLYGVVNLVIWAYAEAGIGIIVGCAGTLRPLFAAVFKVGSSSDHRDTYTMQSRKPRSKSYNGIKVPSVDSRVAGVDKDQVVTNIVAGRAVSESDGSSIKDNDSQHQILEGNGIHVRYEVDTAFSESSRR